MLHPYFTNDLIEAGCDEAGRGCLAGPVFAAAVILPKDFDNDLLNDSKKLTENQRLSLRPIIENSAISWAVASIDNNIIDKINILNASILAMHEALKKLTVQPDLILVDGNRFKRYENKPHKCIIKGDSLYMSIAAASILAKTYRDEFMNDVHAKYPNYKWDDNKGYPTLAHRQAIVDFGVTELHRKTFKLTIESSFDF